VFRGQFEHTIDPKGRLSIPAKFREALAEGLGDKLVIVPNGDCLDVHPLKVWQDLETKVSELPRLDPDKRLFRHLYLSRGIDVALDPQGRIQIVQKYREAVGLVKDVTIVGMTEYFEVWDAERWAHHDRAEGGKLGELWGKLAARGV
jgi:MraZ protein